MRDKRTLITGHQSPSEPLDEFIFKSIAEGCRCILLGEHHNGASAIAALSGIAERLRAYAERHQIKFVVFTENLPAEDPLIARETPKKILEKDINGQWIDIEILHDKGISIYGLENETTDPVTSLINDNSIEFEEMNNFLKKYNGLFEFFVLLTLAEGQSDKGIDYEKAAADYFIHCCGKDSLAYKIAAAGAYIFSDHRLCLANEQFSKYILQICHQGKNICLVIVGATHIPRAKRRDDIVDEGLEARLDKTMPTRSTFVVAASDPQEGPYYPRDKEETNLTYTAITHISRALPPLTFIFERIDALIEEVQGFIFNLNKQHLITDLEALKKRIQNEVKFNNNTLFSKVIENWRYQDRPALSTLESNTVISCIDILLKQYGSMTIQQLIAELSIVEEKVSQYQKIVALESEVIRKINSSLSKAELLKSELLLKEVISVIKPLTQSIETLIDQQLRIVRDILENNQLVFFLRKLFPNKLDTIFSICAVENFVCSPMFTAAEEEEEESKNSLIARYRYINALIKRYILLAVSIKINSLGKLAGLLEKSETRIFVVYDKLKTEVDPLDGKGKKSVNYCVRTLRNHLSKKDINELYEKDPHSFHTHCLSTVYKANPNPNRHKIKFLRLRLHDLGLHEFYLGIENGSVRFYYSPEYMAVLHEELHMIRILEGKTGNDVDDKEAEPVYLPDALNKIYDCSEEYFNIAIEKYSESRYCEIFGFPKRIGHNGILFGQVKSSGLQLIDFDIRYKEWIDVYKEATLIYQATEKRNYICSLLDQYVLNLRKPINLQLTLALLDLKSAMLTAFESKTVSEIITLWKQKFPSLMQTDKEFMRFIQKLETHHGVVVLNPSKDSFKKSYQRKLSNPKRDQPQHLSKKKLTSSSLTLGPYQPRHTLPDTRSTQEVKIGVPPGDLTKASTQGSPPSLNTMRFFESFKLNYHTSLVTAVNIQPGEEITAQRYFEVMSGVLQSIGSKALPEVEAGDTDIIRYLKIHLSAEKDIVVADEVWKLDITSEEEKRLYFMGSNFPYQKLTEFLIQGKLGSFVLPIHKMSHYCGMVFHLKECENTLVLDCSYVNPSSPQEEMTAEDTEIIKEIQNTVENFKTLILPQLDANFNGVIYDFDKNEGEIEGDLTESFGQNSQALCNNFTLKNLSCGQQGSNFDCGFIIAQSLVDISMGSHLTIPSFNQSPMECIKKIAEVRSECCKNNDQLRALYILRLAKALAANQDYCRPLHEWLLAADVNSFDAGKASFMNCIKMAVVNIQAGPAGFKGIGGENLTDVVEQFLQKKLEMNVDELKENCEWLLQPFFESEKAIIFGLNSNLSIKHESALGNF